MENNISEKIFKKIEKDKVTPVAKWIFFIKNVAIWTTGVFVIIAGGIVTALTIYRLTDSDWDVYKNLGENSIIHIIRILPYVWLGAVIFFIAIAYCNIRNTRGGYRYATHIIVFGSIFGSLLLGTAFYSLGFGEHIDAQIGISIPAYESLGYNKEKVWTNPEDGLLSGQIITLRNGSSSFIIKDFSGEIWTIYSNPNIKWDSFALPEIGEQIKIIGKQETRNIFIANEIRPWKGLSDSNERKIFYLRTNK